MKFEHMTKVPRLSWSDLTPEQQENFKWLETPHEETNSFFEFLGFTYHHSIVDNIPERLHEIIKIADTVNEWQSVIYSTDLDGILVKVEDHNLVLIWFSL